jgi:hypothetical protein
LDAVCRHGISCGAVRETASAGAALLGQFAQQCVPEGSSVTPVRSTETSKRLSSPDAAYLLSWFLAVLISTILQNPFPVGTIAAFAHSQFMGISWRRKLAKYRE